MYTSTSTSFIDNRTMDHKTAVKLIKEAGFTAYDMSFCEMLFSNNSRFCDDDYLEYAKEIRIFADQIGIVCNQAHAPFHSSTGDPKKDLEIFNKIVRSMQCAAILGATNIVIHPVQHLKYFGNEQTLKELNLEFYKKLSVYADKFDINIAVENMWKYKDNYVHGQYNKISHSTCSRPQEFCEYVDMINHPKVIACLDIGHVSLVDGDLPDMIKTLGSKRLKALHVHDTDLLADLHTLPYWGKIDYSKVTIALKEIGYTGDITLEANMFINNLPDSLLPAGLKVMAEVAEHLRQQVLN